MGDMDDRENIIKAPMTLSKIKKKIIEEQIDDLKRSMQSLRIAMQHTNDEMKAVFHRVAELQAIVSHVSEDLKMQLEESKKTREKKLLEYKLLMEQSDHLLNESACLINIVEEYIKQFRKRQQLHPPRNTEQNSHENIVQMWEKENDQQHALIYKQKFLKDVSDIKEKTTPPIVMATVTSDKLSETNRKCDEW